MTSVRISQAALDLVKEAARLKGETIVDYLSRISIQQARADIAAEEKRLRSIRQGKSPDKD